MVQSTMKGKIPMNLAPDYGDIVGPYFVKVLKTGEVRFIESFPKTKHIVEYLENIDYFGQDKMHYLTVMIPDGNGKFTKGRQCDFHSVCGHDRGVKLIVLYKRMWEIEK